MPEMGSPDKGSLSVPIFLNGADSIKQVYSETLAKDQHICCIQCCHWNALQSLAYFPLLD